MPMQIRQDANLLTATRVLVTGANGFVGSALCQTLAAKGLFVRGALRRPADYARATGDYGNKWDQTVVGEVGIDTDWRSALAEVHTVVHLAARVHVMKDVAADPLAEFRAVNTAGTLRLATAAAASGAKRFVYVSTIKVNGESTRDRAFDESDDANPVDPYAVSKWEAEQGLRRIASETGLEFIILRPPLVYGPGVGGNFLRMMNWVNRGLPLPLGSIRNSRSLIYLGNLVEALVTCATHPRAAGKIFLVSDGEDVSTPELIRRLAQAMGRRAHLVSFPPVLLRFAGLFTGNSAEVERLLGSLRIDSSSIRRELQWTPSFSMDQGLRETAHWYTGMPE